MIRDLAKNEYISLLSANNEKYISFTIYDMDTNIKLPFLDSLNGMMIMLRYEMCGNL